MHTDDIIIIIEPKTYKVLHVAHDVNALRARLRAAWPGALAIDGDMAKLLFRALTGRNFWDEPEMATTTGAFAARVKLTAVEPIKDVLRGGALARCVLATWGTKIDPGLGVCEGGNDEGV